MKLTAQQLLLFGEPMAPYYDLYQAAAKTNSTHETMRRKAEAGELPGAYKFFGRWRVLKRPFDEWLVNLQQAGIAS